MQIAERGGTNIETLYRAFLRNASMALVGGLLLAVLVAKLLSSSSLNAPAPPRLILYPVFAMFLLTAAVLTRMGIARFGAVRSGTISLGFYRTFDAGEEPERLRVITRHFINLFEVPVLFYVAVIIAHISHTATFLLVGLAWAFVLLRCLHSYVHLSANDVPLRVSFYAASGLVLVVFWGTLFVQLLGSS